MPSKTVRDSSGIQPMSLFPTLETTQDVVALANSKLPIHNKNDVYSLLMIYHNTLLNQLREGRHG